MSVILLIQTVLMSFSFLLLLIKYKVGSVYIDARGGGAKEQQKTNIILNQEGGTKGLFFLGKILHEDMELE